MAAGPGWVLEVQHRIAGPPKLDALVVARQETGAPEAGVDRLGLMVRVFVQQHHVGRQVGRPRSEAVARPGPQGGSSRLLVAGLKKRDGRVVVDRLGVHRIDDADVVGDLAVVRQQVADPLPGFSVLFKGHERLGRGKALLTRGHAREPLALSNRIGQVLTVELFERRFVIKRVDLAGSTGLTQVDDPLGLRLEMRGPGVARPVARAVFLSERRLGPGDRVGAQQVGQRRGADTHPAGGSQEMAACLLQQGFVQRVHGLTSGHKFGQVHQHAGHVGVRGVFGGIDLCRAR